MWLIKAILLVYFTVIADFTVQADKNNRFPEGFIFGCATASYQIEGAWNEDGKSENIWDRLTHTKRSYIRDDSDGDIACDSYHKYEEDIALLKHLGVDFYRFSLSWSRILPNYTAKVNQKGIDYYNNVIDTLLDNGIKPMVTLYHWDLPQYLQDIGGWVNPEIKNYYLDYARIAFENFGDRVPYWTTFNEPKQVCQEGYGDEEKAPALNYKGVGEYMCGHNLLKSHAAVYHLYNQEFKPKQKGKIGIVIYSHYFDPASDRKEDLEAQDIAMQFSLGWWANPIFHPNGNYPDIVIKRVAERSAEQGFPRSRLPSFTNEEVEYIKGTSDYFGLNHYTTRIAKAPSERLTGEISWDNDIGVIQNVDESWPESASDWLRVAPFGLRKMLNWIKERYGDWEIIITENGVSDKGEIDDQPRINYYKAYLRSVLDAIHEDGVKVVGYTAWSLLDNFEWFRGYSERFGLYSVDLGSPNRTRTEKSSAKFYKNLLSTRILE